MRSGYDGGPGLLAEHAAGLQDRAAPGPARDWAHLSLPVHEVRWQLAIKPQNEYREVLATAPATVP
ncbi:MAG: hypothetical protein OXH09_01945 [Gammaproteobacteria bacterium]|nr:hypothetical protein [Gammaproteobacteria bacterium]